MPEFRHGLLSHGAKKEFFQQKKNHISTIINSHAIVDTDSHRCPLYWYEHLQLYVNGPSKHVPPLRQGCEVHLGAI